MDVNQSFDLMMLVDIVRKFTLRRVVLQFPDELITVAMDVYQFLRENIDNTVDIYICVDSTYGSSVDDVSALHIDTDLLVYFGSDMSVSGSLPVIVLPEKKSLNLPLIGNAVANECADRKLGSTDCLILCEPCYFHLLSSIQTMIQCSDKLPFTNAIHIGKLPDCVNILNWSKTIISSPTAETEKEFVGGMHVPNEILKLSSAELCILYIGNKKEQLNNIFLRLSQYIVLHYNPELEEIKSFIGQDSRVFQQRYGGVSAAKDASIIGIIIGSMGLTGDIIKSLVYRLQTLITAAKKNYYTFVMGRINEAKLSNFPEIDVYCLISNEDSAIIPPKTFHKPVIAPYELQLALGAFEWSSTYFSSTVYRNSDINNISDLTEEWEEQLKRVRALWKDEEDDMVNEDILTIDANKSHSYANNLSIDRNTSDSDSALVLVPSVAGDGKSSTSTSGALILFESAAAEYFNQRSYQGLVSVLSESTLLDTSIREGQSGIAKDYNRPNPIVLMTDEKSI